MVLCFDVLRKVVRTLSEQKNDVFVAWWISQRKGFGGVAFPQIRWFSGGKWDLPPMKRGVSSRFAFTPRVGVRIEMMYDASVLTLTFTPRAGVRIENKPPTPSPPTHNTRTAHTVEEKTSQFVPFFLLVYPKCYIIKTSETSNSMLS